RFVGGRIGPLPGITNRVMLCAGSVAVIVVPDTGTSATRVMALALVSCQACAGARGVKFAMLTVAVVVVEDLLMAISVSAPSAVRTAANAETVSGFGTAAATLTSPK